MEFRVLGALEARSGDTRLALGGPRQRTALAVLLVEANRVVLLGRLVEALWDAHPPATARKQVSNLVSRLRAALSPAGEPGISRVNGIGYRMTVGEGQLDVLRFETGVAQAKAAAAVGNLARAVERLQVALNLWRGPALAGLSGHVIEAAAAYWNERRIMAQELHLEYQLALGRHHEAVADLMALADDNPLRERPVALLMLALHRCGRQSEALRSYATMRAQLADEMGLDPSADLQHLHQQILTSDPAIATARPPFAIDQILPQGPTPAIPRQLPAAPRHFTGRTEQLKTLSGLIDDAARAKGTVMMSTIDGGAGVGKTALALHWAHQVADRFPDGQLYVNLRGFEPPGRPLEPTTAIRGFLTALAVPPAEIPASLDEQVGLYRSLLANKKVLVLLDNAYDVEQVRALLPGGCPSVVLVTSRNRLGGLIVGEGAIPVTLTLLATAEAHELLGRRLGSERIAREPNAVADLIELCARLPLALNIAAARAVMNPARPLTDVVEQMRDTPPRWTRWTTDLPAHARAVFR